MKRVITTGLALLMLLGCILIPASAYTTPDFADVPQNNWAYQAIMEAADLKLVNGVGNNLYAPAESLTVNAFLAMIGRSMYPADCNEEGTSTWWETYYDAAIKNNIIVSNEYAKTADDMGAVISRNEMARILVRVDSSVLKNPAATNVDTSKITDYATIPAAYQHYVAQAYAKNLLQGDPQGNFNGGENLDRAAAATVLMRLYALKTVVPAQPDDSFKVTNAVAVTITGGVQVNRTLTNSKEAGVKVFLVSKADGSILGQTTTAKDGTFSLSATLKANQFIAEVPEYFMVATYVHTDGMRFSNIAPDKNPNGTSLTLLKSGLYGDNASYMHPVAVMLHVYNAYPEFPAKFS